uniref:Ribonuclease H-like domain-containing protein n=1 Tax=Tanacetum cinerariifolium TaxID=118510 RepID=A0A6L2KYS0_TANCI|nr:ribonuclease H-like domain-containing protein [Tanacetum cinerariifolium]
MAEFEEDPQEEPEEEVEEDPKEGPEEGPEEDPEAEAEDDVPPHATPPVGSLITLPPLSESSSDTEDDAPKKRKVDIETCSSKIREGKKRMDKMEQGLGDEMQFSNRVEHRRLGTLEANYSLVLSDRDEWRRAFLNLQALVFERLGRGACDARPDKKYALKLLERAHMITCNPSRTPVDTESKLGPEGLFLSQKKYALKLLERAHMVTCNPSRTPVDTESKLGPEGCPSTRSIDAEYQGVANVVAETAWIHNLLCELHSSLLTATLVYCENVSVVYMSANPVQHQQTKRIEIDIHFVCDMVTVGHVCALHIPSHFLIVGALVYRLRSKETCQKRDLWMMNALEESRGINLAWVIAEHLCKHAPGLKENSLIYGGHYATKIAKSLGYLVNKEVGKCSEPIECGKWTTKMLENEFDMENYMLLRPTLSPPPTREERDQRQEPSGLNSSWGD